MKNILFALVLGLIFSSGAVAAPSWVSVNDYRVVKSLYVHDTGTIFYLKGDPLDVNSSCLGRFEISNTSGNYEGKLAMLMLAYSSSLKIRIYFDPELTVCSSPVSAFMLEDKQ